MFTEQNIAPETAQKILSMQADIRHFLEVIFKGEDRTPFNAHRIGIYIENEEVAIDVGYFNYKELVALHTYIQDNYSANYSADYDRTTYIDHIASKGEEVYASKLSEYAYKTELSMIAWLGSDVGQSFLQKYMENLESK